MPALVPGFPEATPARAPLRSRTGETAFTPSLPVQVALGDTVGWVPGHRNIASITVKGVTQVFGFPVHIEATFILYYHQLNVQ